MRAAVLPIQKAKIKAELAPDLILSVEIVIIANGDGVRGYRQFLVQFV